MYVNFQLAKEKGLKPNDIIVLQLIHQNKTEELSPFIAMCMDDSLLESLEQEKIVNYIKGTKRQTQFDKIRLTSKGKKLLEDIQVPEVSSGDVDMFEYLCSMYLSHEDEERTIGNNKKTKMYVSIFRKNLQLTLHQMYWLCWFYLNEEKFTKRLEYIFFNSNKNRYGSFKENIEDSSLYQFYQEREEEVRLIWKKKDCL